MGTVLDFTHLAAAYGPRLLAEAGHRVIRVESPGGDDLRRAEPFLGGRHDLEHGAYHQFLNAGKESLTLEPQSGADRELFAALVRLADCAIVSRPFALSASDFLAANPELVLIDVDDVPSELVAYARAGLLALTGHQEEPPVVLGGHAALAAIGLYVAVAAAAALLGKTLGNGGTHIEVSASQAMESLGEQAALAYHTTGKTTERRGFRGAITAVSGAFPCSDGYWMVSLPHTAAGWARLMEWVGDPELAADDSLSEEDARLEKRDYILDRLTAWSMNYSKNDLVQQAQDRHIPASPVATALDLAQDPQLIARGFLRNVEHPTFGTIRFPVGAIASRKDVAMRPAPRLGEDTLRVRRELGLP